MCSPQAGLSLSVMCQSLGGFSRPGEAVLLPLNEKRWGPFTPPAAFFFSFVAEVLWIWPNLPICLLLLAHLPIKERGHDIRKPEAGWDAATKSPKGLGLAHCYTVWWACGSSPGWRPANRCSCPARLKQQLHKTTCNVGDITAVYVVDTYKITLLIYISFKCRTAWPCAHALEVCNKGCIVARVWCIGEPLSSGLKLGPCGLVAAVEFFKWKIIVMTQSFIIWKTIAVILWSVVSSTSSRAKRKPRTIERGTSTSQNLPYNI